MEQVNHAEVQDAMKNKSEAELRYIIKDCQEALKAFQDSPKAGVYQDTIHYAAMELRKRK